MGADEPLKILPLIFGSSLSQFVERGWLASAEHLYRPNLDRRLPTLFRAGREPIERLVRRHRGPLGVQAVINDRLVPRFPVTPDEALEAIARGENIQLYRSGDTLPEVADLERALLSDLGLGELRPVSTIFVSPAGAGQPRHFDDKDVWIFGLSGEKIFLIEPNHEEQVPDWIETRGEIHDGMTEVLVRPGDGLFLPRGIWHATRASGGPAFSLSIGIRRPTLLDILVERLRSAVEARCGTFGGGGAVDVEEDVARCLARLTEASRALATRRARRRAPKAHRAKRA